MARVMKTMMGDVVYQEPKRPKTEVFVYQHVLDPFEVERLRHRPEFVESLKRMMAHKLADRILETCQVFEIPEFRALERGVPIRMELTINDRGTYENWIPRERDAAKREGFRVAVEEVRKSTPYGFELDQYYE